jgi:hypothetical protein
VDATGSTAAPPMGDWRLGAAAPGEPAPEVAAWTGNAVLLWGGWEHVPGRSVVTMAPGDPQPFQPVASGLVYDPATDAWSRIADAPVGALVQPLGVWTGTELVVWGGLPAPAAPGSTVWGAAYDPSTETWRTLEGRPDVAFGAAVWTGHELVVVGTMVGGDHTVAAAAWDPSTGAWRSLPAPPSHIVLTRSSRLVWTGTELLAFPDFGDAARLDPTEGAWRPIPASPLGERVGSLFVWTGREVLQLGGGTPVGGDSAVEQPGSAAYDPATDRWRSIDDVPGRDIGLPVLTGRGLVLVSQTGGSSLRFDDADGRWATFPSPALSPRLTVSTGSSALVFGPPEPFGNDSAFAPFRAAILD